jgi:hypothetical protein
MLPSLWSDFCTNKTFAWLRDGCIIRSSHQVVQCLLDWSYEKLKDKLLLAKDKWSRNWVLQVGVFDATNSTNARRNMLLKLSEGKCKACVLHFHWTTCIWNPCRQNQMHLFPYFGTCVYVCQGYNCEMPSWVSCWNQFICIHHSKLTLDFWTVIVVGHPSSSFRLWQPHLFLHSLLCIFLQVIFLETICNDRSVIDTNIRLKIQQSPDYADM